VNAEHGQHRVQLFGSGAILRSALKAQELLAEKFHVSSDVWSVTSYTELRRDAQTCARWNMLHPAEPARKSYLETVLEGVQGPFVSASDYVRAVGEQLAPWIPGDYLVLGCDGMGRSETRTALRKHFEVDAPFIALGALHQLRKQGKIESHDVAKAIQELAINPEKPNPLYA
jgi:pyruvate dehydrogenase E1 component